MATEGTPASCTPMSASLPAPAPRLAVLDGLRGLAALWVGLFHFTANGAFNEGFPADMPLKWLGTYGYLGVYAFFVISGFILPWTLERGGYRLKDYGRFLWKRTLRLHPLYLLSVVTMLLPVLWGGTSSMESRTWRDWWPHFFYLNGLLDRPWLMQIYWTLALEAQYYLAIGLIFPLLVHGRAVIRSSALALVIGLPLLSGDTRTIVPFAALFGIGLLIFQHLSGRMSLRMTVPCLLVATAVTGQALGPPQAAIGLLSAAIILGLPLRHRFLVRLGEISYPFYLFHLAIAGVFMPWLISWPRHPWSDLMAVMGLFLLALAVSWGLNRLVERPLQVWSGRLRYRRHPGK